MADLKTCTILTRVCKLFRSLHFLLGAYEGRENEAVQKILHYFYTGQREFLDFADHPLLLALKNRVSRLSYPFTALAAGRPIPELPVRHFEALVDFFSHKAAIHLRSITLTPEYCHALQQLTQLRELSLKNCPTKGLKDSDIVALCRSFSELKTLDISGIARNFLPSQRRVLVKGIVDGLSDSLEKLSLYDCAQDKMRMPSVSHLTNLTELNLRKLS
jgi:hypothetical protein